MAKTVQKRQPKQPAAAVQTTPAQSVETSEKAGPGRKPLPVDYENLPVAGKNFSRAADFERFLSGYPDSPGVMGYVYRVRPKIDFGLIGRSETNIYETPDREKLTAAYIAANWGRGRYSVRLCDGNRPSGHQQVSKSRVDLEDCEKPPVYDIRTLVLSEPENLDEVNRQIQSGVLVRDASGVPRVRTNADGSIAQPAGFFAGGAAPAAGEGLVEKLLVTFMGKLIESPHDRMKETFEMAKMLQPATPAYTLEQMADLVAQRLSNGTGVAARDPFAAWEKVEAFAARFRPAAGETISRGIEGAGARSLISEITDLVSGLAKAIPAVLQGYEYLQRQRAAAAARGPVIVPFNQNATAGAPPATPAKEEQTMLPLPERIADVSLIGFQKMKEGMKGIDYASWVFNWYPGGREVFTFLEPGGADGFIKLVKDHPAAAPLLADSVIADQLHAFLADFFDYDAAPDDEGDASNGGEASGASAVA